MFMTDTLKLIADAIVDYYKKLDGTAKRLEEIQIQDSSKGFTKEKIRYVVSILVSKGMLISTPYVYISALTTLQPTYYLSDKGWLYESYDKLIEEENRKEKLIHDQIQSVIDTNTAVQTNFQSQKKLRIGPYYLPVCRFFL
jgi:hypothetical protein